MKRREMLLSLSAGLATSSAFAASAKPAGCADPARSFAAARAGEPWARAFESLNNDLEALPLTLRGRLPRGLAGAFYRNGPARHELGGQRYRHLFDGDGAVQRYDLGLGGNNTITHQARFVRTAKFEADSAAGHPVRASFATQRPGMAPVNSADSINVANTSIVAHGGRLLALWEGGSAYEIDPSTLATRGVRDWSVAGTPALQGLTGMPFSAHPRVEPDGTMWNFGVSSLAGALTLYRIGRDGVLKQTATVPLPGAPMVHDFAVTERHLIFLLPPYMFDADRLRAGATFFDSYVWQPELGLRAWVFDKADLTAAPRRYALPAGFVFHIGNACEEGGVIRLDCMRAPDDTGVREGLVNLMCGRGEAWDGAQPMLVELELAGARAEGRARQTVLPWVAEFPRIDPRHVGRHYSSVFMLLRSPAAAHPLRDSVARLDLARQTLQRYHYGASVIAEEHVFVPRPGGAEGQGWLLGSALDLARGRTLFSVFDAEHLADGPLAQGEMARTLPAGLHGIFVPAAAA